jgi:hypothetical protein
MRAGNQEMSLWSTIGRALYFLPSEDEFDSFDRTRAGDDSAVNYWQYHSINSARGAVLSLSTALGATPIYQLDGRQGSQWLGWKTNKLANNY